MRIPNRTSYFLAVTFSLMASATFAIENSIAVKWGQGIRANHEYTITVTNFSGMQMAGPYERLNRQQETIGIRGDNQSRRETKICVIPEAGATPLVGGVLVLNDNRGYPLMANSDGVVCTPDGVNVDSPDIAYLEVNAK